ncbi:MAG: nucleotide-binding protein [Nitrosopumilales archaeon CG15_BIG_FIL_POST_REV_8_21_14_020_37_12]|nr:MAG: nucleotide-binding protein [Nitrosopumilales archaeon CG15_BIG_FIL_POST_REV_8_21_14_020_37_12]
MDFRILDASAFYAGVPFGSDSDCYTTSLVYEEIKHIKKNEDALGTLMETNRLKIMDPDKESINAAVASAKQTGDFQQLSKQDISIIALCINLGGLIITDDFAVTNVARNIGLRTSSIMTTGIQDVGKWVHYCPGCRTNHTSGKECPMCGTPLKRKLLKGESSSVPLNK